MKVFDTGAYVSELRALCLAGHTVSCRVVGGSMAPFFADGRDTVVLHAPSKPPRCGDIVFYQRENGSFILHRIVHLRRDGTYDLVGDAQSVLEYGIRREQIFAVVTEAQRRGKWITPRTLVWRFFSVVWCAPLIIPLRPALLSLWSILRKKRP